MQKPTTLPNSKPTVAASAQDKHAAAEARAVLDQMCGYFSFDARPSESDRHLLAA